METLPVTMHKMRMEILRLIGYGFTNSFRKKYSQVLDAQEMRAVYDFLKSKEIVKPSGTQDQFEYESTQPGDSVE